MKILTRTTTLRLLPDIYERVLLIAHRERKHPTSVMREAITAIALRDTLVSPEPKCLPASTQLRVHSVGRSASDHTLTEPVRPVSSQVDSHSNTKAEDLQNHKPVQTNSLQKGMYKYDF